MHATLAPSLGDRMLQAVQRLLSAAPKLVNAKDSHGATPLMYAAMKGSIQVGSQRNSCTASMSYSPLYLLDVPIAVDKRCQCGYSG